MKHHLIPPRRKCTCDDHHQPNLPVRIFHQTALNVRSHHALAPDLPLLTVRCPRCKAMVTLTLEDCYLAG